MHLVTPMLGREADHELPIDDFGGGDVHPIAAARWAHCARHAWRNREIQLADPRGETREHVVTTMLLK